MLTVLVVRVDASPADDPPPADDARAEAIHYANILTGDDPDDDPDVASSDLDDEDEDRSGDDDDDDDDDDRDEPVRSQPLGDDGEPDRLANLNDAAPELSAAALAGHVTGELAMLDAGAMDSGAGAGDDVSFAAASAGAAETYESWMRHQRPSRWGRLDLGVEWRRRWSEPMSGLSRRYDEVWLVATWRR